MNPPSLAELVEKTLLGCGIAKDDTLLLGFSGGRDSVTLLELLLESGFTKLILAHLDHGLRPESSGDAAWVQQQADARGLPSSITRVEVSEAAPSRHTGIEQAAREARLAFFADCARKHGTNKIVLAHHADDQVETLLFRLLRGAGSLGLGAMQFSSARTIQGQALLLLRPMLAIWRAQIDSYLQRHPIDFREDASNAQTDFTRNRIRHLLIPELEKAMQRPVRDSLWRTAEILRADAEFIDQSERALPPTGSKLDATFLKALPLALRRRRVARWLAEQCVTNISFELVEAVAGLAISRTPAKINLPGGGHARRRAGQIFCE
jgi:tRNA(Ile)-lysidine synthase